MLIQIESTYGDKLICGSYLDREELQNALIYILQIVSEKDFLTVFCTRYRYEEIPCSDTIRVDYIIDLDTHLLIKPKY